MRLLGVPVHDQGAGLAATGLPGRGRRGPIAAGSCDAAGSIRSRNAARTQRSNIGVVDPAGDGDHHPVRRVPAAVVAGDLRPGHRR